MKKNSVLIFAALIVMALGFQSIAAQDEQVDGRLLLFFDQIAKAQKEIDQYSTQDGGYLVTGNSRDWLWRAVSTKMRSQFLDQWKVVMNQTTRKRFDDAFSQLSASAAKKLPTYIPGNQNFAFHNLAEEKMMKGTLEDPSTIKILKIGFYHGTWQISKNDYGLPEARYKQGYMYVRNTADSHPYCRLFQINIIQDYAGGGTYGQSYARFLDDNLFGCPAGTN